MATATATARTGLLIRWHSIRQLITDNLSISLQFEGISLPFVLARLKFYVKFAKFPKLGESPARQLCLSWEEQQPKQQVAPSAPILIKPGRR